MDNDIKTLINVLFEVFEIIYGTACNFLFRNYEFFGEVKSIVQPPTLAKN
jgi:hypothetical protein